MLTRLFARRGWKPVNKEDEGRETLLAESSDVCSSAQSRQGWHDRRLNVAAQTCLLCTVVYAGLAILVGFILRGTPLLSNADDFCLHHVQLYSPVIKEVKAKWHTVQYNGSFFHATIYRQDASPEVDAAWDVLGGACTHRPVVVPEREAARSGLRHDQVKISQRYGGGYPAKVEGLHHLHCLDLLRRALKWNYDYYREKKEGVFVNSDYVVKYHVTHCLDMLRQQLMCTPDTGVMGQVWYQPDGEPRPIPFVHFNTKHKCRDYEGVRQWAEAHQLPPEREVEMEAFYEKPKPGDSIFTEIP